MILQDHFCLNTRPSSTSTSNSSILLLFISVRLVNISSATAVITYPGGTQWYQATLQDQVYRYI